MGSAIRRGCLFAQAYLLLLDIHRTLRRQAFAGARRRYLRPWKRRSRSFSADDQAVRDIEWAIQTACEWQWLPSHCLHRALAAYVLLRARGGQPRFVIGVRMRPFASHAWTHTEGVPVADAEMQDLRFRYTPAMQFPAPAPAAPGSRGASALPAAAAVS